MRTLSRITAPMAKGRGAKAYSVSRGWIIPPMLATEKVAAAFTPGTHAATFGGNPVAAAAAGVVLRHLLAPGFLEGVREKGEYFRAQLTRIAQKHSRWAEGARGLGLLVALTLTEAGREKGPELVAKMFERGMIINFAGGQVLRFVPPLIVSKDEIDRLVAGLDAVLAELG